MPGHAPGLAQGPHRIIGLVKDMPEKNEVEGPILERKTLRDSLEKPALGHEVPCLDEHGAVRIDPCRPQRFTGERFSEDPGSRADIQHAFDRQAFPGQLDDPGGFQERHALWGAKPLRAPVITTFVTLRAVFHRSALRRGLSPRGKPEYEIQRAETDDSRDEEDDRKDAEDDRRDRRELIREVQRSNHHRKNAPNDPVCNSHVPLHTYLL